MILRITMSTILFLTGFRESIAQIFPARYHGMAGAGLCISDVWSPLLNTSATASAQKISVGVSVNSPFLLRSVTGAACNVSIPVKRAGVFGVTYETIGVPQMLTNAAGIFYARTLGKYISAGMRVVFHTMSFAQPYGSIFQLGTDISVTAGILPKFKASVVVSNPVRMNPTAYESDRLPFILRAGFSWKWSGRVESYLDLVRHQREPISIRLGTEIKPTEAIRLTTGFSALPFSMGFGFGYTIRKFSLFTACNYHTILGFSPAASIDYIF